MSMPNTKQRILDTVQSLPNDATIEDAMEKLYFLAKVERGVQQADRGEGIPHGEIKKRFAE